MARPTELADRSPSLVVRMAERYGIDSNKMLATLKATAFKQHGENAAEVSNEQMLALLVVAEQYDLNPWTREIFAFPDKQKGIVPVVSVDGWARIINSNPMFDGMEFVESEDVVTGPDHKPCPAWIECVIYRKDRTHPIRIRERFDECYRPPFRVRGRNGGADHIANGPWQTHTSRFLRHKTMIQCARIAFGFGGIYDLDEAERIIDAVAISTTVAEAPAKPKMTAKAALDHFSGRQTPQDVAPEDNEDGASGVAPDTEEENHVDDDDAYAEG